jgi:hypothetical protein
VLVVVLVVVEETGGEDREGEGTEAVVEETVEHSDTGVLVVVVAVVEEAGAVETERGGWEVGGTAEDEEEREGVADSAAGVLVVVVETGGEDREGEGTEAVVEETVEHSDTGVLVVVVAVVEEAGAVETERGGWEVGGTAEDEEEREGVADSAEVDVQRVSHGIESLSMSPNSPESTEHVHTLSLSTVAGRGQSALCECEVVSLDVVLSSSFRFGCDSCSFTFLLFLTSPPCPVTASCVLLPWFPKGGT